MPRARRKKMVGEALVPGLRMDPDLARRFLAYAETQAEAHGLQRPNLTSAARDLLRLALDMHPVHSCDKEAYFQALAEARRKVADALGKTG